MRDELRKIEQAVKGECPKCKSKDIKYDNCEIAEDGRIAFPFICRNCCFLGIEWYSMSYIETRKLESGSFAADASCQKVKNFDNKIVDAYCTRHFEKSFEEKLEEVRKRWLDNLEEQLLAEQEVSMEDSQ